MNILHHRVYNYSPALLHSILFIGVASFRLRCGDRFFYDLGVDPVVQLSRRQLQEVRKVSLARILCNVFGDLKNVQPRAMHIPDPVVNRPVPCSEYVLFDIVVLSSSI